MRTLICWKPFRSRAETDLAVRRSAARQLASSRSAMTIGSKHPVIPLAERLSATIAVSNRLARLCFRV